MALGLLAGCQDQDPIVGRWEPASGQTKLVWRFAADGTGGFDTSRLEADLKQRSMGKPLSAPMQKLLDAEKAKTFRWKRDGAYYRLEAPHFQRTEKGSLLFAQLENGELRFSPPVSAPSVPRLVLRRAAD